MQTLLQVHEATILAGAYPSPLNYFHFPKSVCTSVNEVCTQPKIHQLWSTAQLKIEGTSCKQHTLCCLARLSHNLHQQHEDVALHVSTVSAFACCSLQHICALLHGQICHAMAFSRGAAAQVICHGIPDKRPLEDGDIVNVDVTAYYKGYHGDLNETYVVGQVDDASKKLIKAAHDVRPCAVACLWFV